MMSQPLKLLGGAAALITAALVGGTLIGSVLAAPSGSPSTGVNALFVGDEALGDTGEYCQVFLDTFAEELGVSTDELAPAAKAAATAAVNAAVENGDLTEEQGEALIERINDWDGTGCAFIGFHLRHGVHHGIRVEFMRGMFEAAADVLGMEVGELREALVDSTLEEVAEAEGVDYADVVAAALASAKADLDAAVEAGQITQDKADAIYARLEAWFEDGGPGNWSEHEGRPGPGRFFIGPPGSTDDSTDGSAEGTSA